MLIDDIKKQVIVSLKGGDERRYEALKLLVSALSYARINKGEDLGDEEELEVLKKEARKRRESVEIYEKAGSADKAEQEAYELSLIEKYLPEQMGEAEVRAKIEEIASGSDKVGGQLIGEVMGKLKGQVDGGMVARIVTDL